jgi:hypothetical protein
MKGRQTLLTGSLMGVVGVIRNMTPGRISADRLDKPDVTLDHDYKQFESGLIDPGECTYTIEYDGDETGDYAKARTYIGVVQTFTITHPDMATDACSGFIADVDRPNATETDTLIGDIVIKFSGEPTFSGISASVSPSVSPSPSPS